MSKEIYIDLWSILTNSDVDYSDLDSKTLKVIYREWYSILPYLAQNGNMTPICTKIDLERALMILTEEERSCIVSCLINGETYSEYAQKNNISTKAIYTMVNTGIIKSMHYLKTGKAMTSGVAKAKLNRHQKDKSKLRKELKEFIKEIKQIAKEND